MSRDATACGTTASAVAASAGQGTDVAGVLRDKDSIIRAQAKRIGQLEREAERVRKERDSLATKVALLTYKLQMYSKDLHQHSRQTMNFTERKQTSENTSRRLESSSSSSSCSSNRTLSSTAAPTSKQPTVPGQSGRPLPPQPKTATVVSRSSPSDKLLQRSHRVQKRTSDEDEKIKRSRDWDYELSQDLQAKQIEMLEKKYGGALRAGRAARIIQQAYRQYCLNKNFAKLRLEADSRRLSRRFTDFGRSKTLWTDMVMTTMEYGGTPPVQHLASGSATPFSNQVYGNSGTDVRPEDAACSRVITHSSAAFSNYYCKVLQKSLTMSVSASEHNVQREAPQPPVRHTPTADLGMIREMGHDSGFNSGEIERSRNEQRRQQMSNAESSQRMTSTQTRVENQPNEADLSVWLVEKTGPVCGFGVNGNDDDVAMSMGGLSSYVDHNLIDNNLDFDIEGNAPEPPYLGYGDLPLSESPYCEQHKCTPLGMPIGQSDPLPGYYDGGIQVCRIPTSSMAPPTIQTSCSSPSNHVYSSLRLCSLRHGVSPSVPAVENLASRQPSTGSPVWKRKNIGDGFGYVYEADPRGPEHPDRGGCSTGQTAVVSAGAQMGGIVAPQGAYIRGAPLAACTDCAQLLHHYHHHHHHHHHHHMLQQQAKVSDKQRKRTYRIGLNLFNKKPEKGIRYLIERRFLDNRPNAVARFLISRKGLSKQMIGEYLGNLQKQFNMEVLRCFADEIDLTGLDVDVALRKFQSYFRMPGEAQKIERLMEAFASQYCQCNPHVVRTFRRADTVFLLAFATIMLNTDLHNKSIKAERKMKLNDFIRNLRGIDDGEDIDPNLLTGIYERMKVSEFQPGSDHVTQVAKVEQSIVGKRPQLAALHRRLVCYCRLYEVQDLSRREKLGLHQREVFLFNDMLMVTKILGKKKSSVSYSFRSSFSLSGMGVYLFDTAHYKYGIRLVCSSSKKDYVMLYARNEHDRTKFVEDLKDAILEMNEMEALRIEEELQKQKVQQKHCNYNRHSKDSGVVDIELLRPSDFAINRHSTADCVSVGRAPISGSLVDMSESCLTAVAWRLQSIGFHTLLLQQAVIVVALGHWTVAWSAFMPSVTIFLDENRTLFSTGPHMVSFWQDLISRLIDLSHDRQ